MNGQTTIATAVFAGLGLSFLSAVPSAESATLQFQGPAATVTARGGAIERLRVPGQLAPSPASLTLRWAGTQLTFTDSDTRADAFVELEIILGLSVSVGAKVLAFPEEMSGKLAVSNTGVSWELRQFNFGRYCARITHDTERGHVGMMLPLLLKPASPAAVGPLHGVLILGCSLAGESLVCASAGFGMEPVVAASFPGEPSVAETIRQVLQPPRAAAAAPPKMLLPSGRQANCCMGAWACQCVGEWPLGGCSYVCRECFPDPYCFQCHTAGCEEPCGS